jgi:hypothetical protein
VASSASFAQFQEKYESRWPECINRTHIHMMFWEQKVFELPRLNIHSIQQPHEVRILLDTVMFNGILAKIPVNTGKYLNPGMCSTNFLRFCYQYTFLAHEPRKEPALAVYFGYSFWRWQPPRVLLGGGA